MLEDVKLPLSDDITTWRRMQRSVLEANRHMFDNKVACDVTFLFPFKSGEADGSLEVKEEGMELERVEAHRYVLCSRSPVFYAMFYGPVAQDNPSQEIIVTDVCADVFHQLLRFLYYEEAELTEENVFAVLYGSKKYLIEPLAERCRALIKKSINADQVCTILDNSLLLSEQGLVDCCLRFIRSSVEDVVTRASFTDVSLEFLEVIVRMQELNIEEVDLFVACIRWAVAELQRSQKLSDDALLTPHENNKSGYPGVISVCANSETILQESIRKPGPSKLSSDSKPKKQVRFRTDSSGSDSSADGSIDEQINNAADKTMKYGKRSMPNKMSTNTLPCINYEFVGSQQLRQTLRTVLPCIKFDTMSLHEIEEIVRPTNVLDQYELNQIVKRMAETRLHGCESELPVSRNKPWQEPVAVYHVESVGTVNMRSEKWKASSKHDNKTNKSVTDQKKSMINSGFNFSVPFKMFW